jgi:hypothetical protein
MTQQEIAFQLGVNQGRVNEVIKRGKWLSDDPNAPEAVTRNKALDRMARGEGTQPKRPQRAKGEGKARKGKVAPPRAQLSLDDL